VLAGHLDRLADGLQDDCRFVVVCRPQMTELKARFEGRVDWIDAPADTARWLPRAVWEYRNLQKLADACSARAYFTPSGIAASALDIPQVVLCQNPWAMVPSARRRRDFLKAWLQRRAYRQTMKTADVMVFNSEYMRQAYRQNAGFNEKRSIIAYQAADEETRSRSEHWKNRPRNPGQILCVSAMAPHKNVEALLSAFEKLKNRNAEKLKSDRTSAEPSFQNLSLHLVGSWPDSMYEKKMLRLIADLGLGEQVQMHGFVCREELDRLYAEAQVFCLMSRCESFGIPAIEAQLFGTPVVCSTACAVPEVCGDGGLFCDPDDISGIAEALQTLLYDSNVWENYSEKARRNACRFQWVECSRPLAELFERMMENVHE